MRDVDPKANLKFFGNRLKNRVLVGAIAPSHLSMVYLKEWIGSNSIRLNVERSLTVLLLEISEDCDF